MATGMVNDRLMVYCIRRSDVIDLFVMYNGLWCGKTYSKDTLGEYLWKDFSFLIEGELIFLGDFEMLTEFLFPKYIKITEDNFGDYIDLKIGLIGSLLRRYGLIPDEYLSIIKIYKNILYVLKERNNENDKNKAGAIKEFLLWWKTNMWLEPYVESEIGMLLSTILVFFNIDVNGYRILNTNNERSDYDNS